MRTVFLAGGIGSGKSTVASALESLGCRRIDLDALSREVLEPGTDTTRAIAESFGEDLLDPVTGTLDRRALAARAFATRQDAARLEALELPAIASLLKERVCALAHEAEPPALCLVEVPLLDRMGELRYLADEVVVVDCPLALRRQRAIARGMTGADFDARSANQPTDEWLAAQADTIISNSGSEEELLAQVHAWYASRAGGL